MAKLNLTPEAMQAAKDFWNAPIGSDEEFFAGQRYKAARTDQMHHAQVHESEITDDDGAETSLPMWVYVLVPVGLVILAIIGYCVLTGR